MQKRPLSFITASALLFTFLLGCSPINQTQPFGSSFLPPTPRPVSAVSSDIPEPPPVAPPDTIIGSSPTLFTAPLELPPRPQSDERVRRAEERFQSGKRYYQQGDWKGARREFDRAVETLLATPATAHDRKLAEDKLEEIVERIYRYEVEFAGAQSEDGQYEKSQLQELLELTFPIDPSLRNRVKDEIGVTTSQLPLEENDAVLSYVNFFSSERGRRTLAAGLRRAGRYKQLIHRILDEEGVPKELIFLAQAESGFEPRAVSNKAATGMWQFVQFRGREYGLMQTPYSDDRLDPEKATRAAARHLRDLYKQFGDWYLAMAAYNCGPNGVERAVQRTGYADFWELRSRNALPRETTNYVPLIIAMTLMAKNAGDYGINDADVERPVEYENHELTATTNLALVGDLLDVPVSELRDLNPALLKPIAPAGYQLHVPMGTGQLLNAGLAKVPEPKRIAWRAHRFEAGQTMSGLAKRFNTSLDALTAANLSATPEAGDLVVVPQAERREIPRRVTYTKKGVSKVAGKQPAARWSTVKRPASKVTPRPVASQKALGKTTLARVQRSGARAR